MPEAYKFELVGGDPILELCNTRSWRRDHARDLERLIGVDDFDRWRRLVSDSYAMHLPALKSPDDLAPVLALRDLVLEVLDAHMEGREAPDAIDCLRAMWIAAASHLCLASSLPVHWVAPDGENVQVADLLVVRVMEFLRSDTARLRRCALDECGWFFLDTTKNRSRRWCISSDCGNRARVRAYAQRKRREQTP